jgi:hypothetical protein
MKTGSELMLGLGPTMGEAMEQSERRAYRHGYRDGVAAAINAIIEHGGMQKDVELRESGVIAGAGEQPLSP